MLRTGLLLALLPACVPPDPIKGDIGSDTGDSTSSGPDVTVTPEWLDFGYVAFGESSTQTVTVANEGTDNLEIQGVELLDFSEIYTVSAIGSVLLPPGGSTTFNVTFSPATATEYNTEIRIDTNDPYEPSVSVALGAGGVAPVIEVMPAARDLGTVHVGCESDETFALSNMGNDDLVITAIDLVASSSEFTLDTMEDVNGSLPWSVAPGSSLDVSVAYAPLDEVADTAYLAITSSDPFRPRVEASVEGIGAVYGTNTDTFEQHVPGQVDVIIAVDVSDGMTTDLERISDEANTFFDALDTAGLDYQLAVVSADDGCVLGDTPFVTSAMSRADTLATFQGWLSLAAAGDYTEMGFTLLESATTSTNLAGCNAGLIRADADLAMVGVTDEVEQSANPWSYYVALFQSLKADSDMLRIHGIAGDYPSGCDDAEPGQGWYEASVATGGSFLSICADPADYLTDLADALANTSPESFELSQWPVPETIVVTVDGVAVTGWSYVEANREIVFDETPGDGAVIEVEYATLADCE